MTDFWFRENNLFIHCQTFCEIRCPALNAARTRTRGHGSSSRKSIRTNKSFLKNWRKPRKQVFGDVHFNQSKVRSFTPHLNRRFKIFFLEKMGRFSRCLGDAKNVKKTSHSIHQDLLQNISKLSDTYKWEDSIKCTRRWCTVCVSSFCYGWEGTFSQINQRNIFKHNGIYRYHQLVCAT